MFDENHGIDTTATLSAYEHIRTNIFSDILNQVPMSRIVNDHILSHYDVSCRYCMEWKDKHTPYKCKNCEITTIMSDSHTKLPDNISLSYIMCDNDNIEHIDESEDKAEMSHALNAFIQNIIIENCLLNYNIRCHKIHSFFKCNDKMIMLVDDSDTVEQYLNKHSDINIDDFYNKIVIQLSYILKILIQNIKLSGFINYSDIRILREPCSIPLYGVIHHYDFTVSFNRFDLLSMIGNKLYTSYASAVASTMSLSMSYFNNGKKCSITDDNVIYDSIRFNNTSTIYACCKSLILRGKFSFISYYYALLSIMKYKNLTNYKYVVDDNIDIMNDIWGSSYEQLKLNISKYGVKSHALVGIILKTNI